MLTFAEKLYAFDERFKQHSWWKRCVEGTPLSNDLAVIAVEVLDPLVSSDDYLVRLADENYQAGRKHVAEELAHDRMPNLDGHPAKGWTGESVDGGRQP